MFECIVEKELSERKERVDIVEKAIFNSDDDNEKESVVRGVGSKRGYEEEGGVEDVNRKSVKVVYDPAMYLAAIEKESSAEAKRLCKSEVSMK